MPDAAPARPTLVLLHGVGGNAAGFASLVQHLEERGWPAVAFSQPGYDGTPLVDPYTLAGCADALADWLASRALGRVVLVGHSMGGMLAQTLAARLAPPAGGDHGDHRDHRDHRDEGDHASTGAAAPAERGFAVAGLVLAHTSPAFGNAGGDFQQRFIASRTRPLDEGRTMRDIAAGLVPGMMAPTASAEARERGIAMMAAVPPDTYRRAVAAITAFDGRAHLARLRLPVLCLAAEHDETAPPAVLQRMAERIPGADYRCMSGLGHLAPLEEPARWAAEVAAWCDRRIAA